MTIGHVRLPRKYDSIREAFDIKWPLVEMEKPLYSALAARLFLSNINSRANFSCICTPGASQLLEEVLYETTHRK